MTADDLVYLVGLKQIQIEVLTKEVQNLQLQIAKLTPSVAIPQKL